MRGAASLFSEEQRQRVNEAVADAESKTAAEIVPVVAAASGRYDRAEDIVGIWFSLASVALVWLVFPAREMEPDSWSATPAWLELVSLLAALVAGFVLGAVLGSRVDWLRRLCTSNAQMRDEVDARARAIFFDQRVHHTASGTGVLIYVSLFEHLATVIGDRTAFEKLGQATLDELCAQLTTRLRQGDATAALCRTVQDAGDRLAAVIPRSEGGTNELPNALVTIE